MVTNMKDWVVESRLPSTFVGIEVHLLPIPLYPLELGANISAWKSGSDDLV
ncbi:hypothetical protein CK203_109371 [Vitis vinifera]|uniref:Uncharacterized protein n=1 Tax=Vitis vinifera TaxID=29760 RepID=A0A438BVF7_VITVI|nr:hypothetical protein CK203_109371 [Vitis vinifera]